MANFPISPTTLGNLQHGGALFTLPREVRDEIYRGVVKSHYIIYITQGKNDTIAPEKGEHDFAILEVSKAISHEASEVLYSESVFCFSIDFSVHGILCVPSQFTNRMKNVALDFNGLSTWHSELFPPNSFPTYQDHINTICHAAIADFTGADIARNRLRIKLFCCTADVINILSRHIFERLKALVGFRTIVLEVVPSRISLPEYMLPMSLPEELWKMRKKIAIGVRKEIQKTLEPALGSATKGHLGEVQYLIFHPRDNIVRSTL